MQEARLGLMLLMLVTVWRDEINMPVHLGLHHSFDEGGRCRQGRMLKVPQCIIAILGSMKAVCVLSGVSPLFTPDEMVHQINDSGAKMVVTDDVKLEECLPKIYQKVSDLKPILVCNGADFLLRMKRSLRKLLGTVSTGKVTPLPGKSVPGFSDFCKAYAACAPNVKMAATDPQSPGFAGSHQPVAQAESDMGCLVTAADHHADA